MSKAFSGLSKGFEEGFSKSMVAIIFDDHQLSTELPDTQHTQALEYLALTLSIRDREQITNILCKRQPDLLTQAVRDVVAAYGPEIRSVHNAVDLSGTVYDFQVFLDDLLKLAKAAPRTKKGRDESPRPKSSAKPPSMEDFVSLLKRHQGSSHRFLHQVAKNGPEVTEWFRDYLKRSLGEFQKSPLPDKDTSEKKEPPKAQGAGAMTPMLESLVAELSDSDRATVLHELDEYTAYLSRLQTLSSEKMRLIISQKERTSQGPGIFLARWKALMDDTLLTPSKVEGPVRSGYDKGESVTSIDEEAVSGGLRVLGKLRDKEVDTGNVPTVDTVVRLLGKQFKDQLIEHLSNP